jgi:hypothetical protein
MRTIILILAMTLSAAAAETPLTGLKFGGDVNAGGFSLTNLSPDFASQNGLLKLDENGDVILGGNLWARRTVFYGYDEENIRGVFWANANGTWTMSQGPTNTLVLKNSPSWPNLHNDIFEIGCRYMKFGGETRSNWPAVYTPVSAGTWRNPDWFMLSWSEAPSNTPDTISYRTNLDQVIERQGFNLVKHDRVAQISEQHSFFELSFAVAPTNLASVSDNGYLTHIADGIVTASVTASTYGRTNTLVLRTEGSAIDRYWSAAAGSLRSAIISNVAANVTGATMRTFSTYDTENMLFERSTNLWMKPAPECVAAWNSRSGHLGGGVLLTPRHAVTAVHASFRPQAGDQVAWVDSTNGLWTATVLEEKNVAADIALIRLDQDIPVRVAKFLADPEAALPTGIFEVPLACGETHAGHHEYQLVVGGSRTWGERGYWGIGWWKAAEQPLWREYFRHYPIPGDSSQPVMFSTGTDYVILFCLYYPTSGPNLHAYLPEIEAAIAGWGDTNTLSFLDTTPYTEF